MKAMACLTLMAAVFVCADARAETYVVTATEDEVDAAPGDGVCASSAGRCTLRAAIDESNAEHDFDTIYVSPGRYLLELGPLVLRGQVEVSGRNADWTQIDAQQGSRVVELAPSFGKFVYARLTGLTLENGYAGAPGSFGGAVYIPEPQSLFALDRCIVRNNFASSAGGAIYNAGNLDIERTSIVDNVSDPEVVWDDDAAGGGIYNTGVAAIRRSSIAGNTAWRGGGIANESGIAYIENSTLSGNLARERGGAIASEPGPSGRRAYLDLTFGTVVDNRAGSAPDDPWQPGQGGGIYNAGSLTLASSIIARNTDHRPSDAADCVSEVRAGQRPGDVSVRSMGGVVLGVLDHCEHPAARFDQRGSAAAPLDPLLPDFSSSVAGEVTFGFEPFDGSPALDNAGEGYCVYEDQWGLGRPAAGGGGGEARCDAGAIERSGARRRRSVMMVVGNRTLSPTDLILSIKLNALGFDVVDETPEELSDEVRETNLTLVSETVLSTELPGWLFAVDKPILCLEPAALDDFHMTEEGWDRTQGAALDEDTVRVVADGRVDSSYVGDVVVTDGAAKLGWGVPATADAFKQAELAGAPGRWAIFGYDTGALLADGSRAPAPRVAFFAAEGTPERMTYQGWNLFAGIVNDLAPPR